MSPSGAAPKTPSIFPGATISGRFRVDRLLGRGSMGAVWLARHLTLDVDVAVKFIDAAFRDLQDHRDRFVHEAQSAARINSPHVVNVLDFGEDEGRLYIAMEYLVGEDLGSFLDRAGQVSLDVTARIVAHACRGLGKAHALGIAHRDIKPENLFLCGDAEDEGFVLKILDFGVAKTSERAASFTGTRAGQLIGSPAYMSPEQARGLPQVDGRSDLFSLAVVAYHCLTGQPPFAGDSLAEVLFGIIGSDPTPVSRLVPGLPLALDAWFTRALDKDPKRRFPSGKEMSQAFYLAIGQHASSATDHVSGSALATQISAMPSPVAGFQSESRSWRPRAAKLDASNRTATLGVAPALAQLGEVVNVLGVALVSPELATLAHHSAAGMAAATFSDAAERVSEALDTFQNLESTQSQALALHYENACVVVRWLEGHLLLVVGTEQVSASVLTVTLHAVASKLQVLAKQAGGASNAFKATLSGPTASPSAAVTSIAPPPRASDAVPSYVLAQLGTLFAKPLGALGRLAFQQRLKAHAPTYGSYGDFVQRLASSIEAGPEREAFTSGAELLLGDVLAQIPPEPAARAAGSTRPAEAPPSPVAARAPEAAPAKRKHIVIYRGSKMEVDD